MRRLGLIVFLAGLATAGLAEAGQKPPEPAAAPAAPSPEAEALARRYIAAMHMEQSMKPMLLTMTDAMIKQQAQRYPNLTESQRAQLTQAVMSAVEDSYNQDLLGRMADKMIPGMATVFSVDELRALAEFYESPTGQAIVAKMPAFGKISARAVIELMPEMQNDLQARIAKNVEALKFGG